MGLSSSHEKLEAELGPRLPPEERLVGLKNFGTTCFANATLQALFRCPQLRATLAATRSAASPSSDGAAAADGSADDGSSSSEEEGASEDEGILEATAELFEQMATHRKRVGSIAPRRWMAVLRRCNAMYDGDEHQDAHELLNYVLNELADALDEAAKSASGGAKKGRPQTPADTARIGSTAVHTAFQGLATGEIRCLGCGTVTTRDETFLDVPLDLQGSSHQHQQTLTLAELLERAGEPEMLRGREKFFCDGCRCLQEATRRARFRMLPARTLVIQLKRFKFDEVSGSFRKLNTTVVFPLVLNTHLPDCEDARVYQLSSVVVHFGRGPNQGHYVAVVRCASGDWLLFDDDEITHVPETWLRDVAFGKPPATPNGSTACAYLLFYERDFVPSPNATPLASPASTSEMQGAEREQTTTMEMR